jgi:hypothetical protein
MSKVSNNPDVMQMILDNLEQRGTLSYETYAPPYVCSYAIHAFNVMNQGRKVYWESYAIPNMRLHIIFVAPPGYMKSYYLKNMGMDDYSIFGNCNYEMIQCQNVNEASLVGTYTPSHGNYVKREGKFETHGQGFLMMDEFKGITDAMGQSFNSQMESQLLAALDHGEVRKSVAGGDIEYQTYCTLWGGVQPAKYELGSGMGRRICFLLNLPDAKLKSDLRRAVWDSRNKRPDVKQIHEMKDAIKTWTTSFNSIENIDYDESVFHLYEKFDIEPYEISSYAKLILGWHLAKYGADTSIMLDVQDKGLMDILNKQFEWRRDIITGPDLKQVINLIRVYGTTTDDGRIMITRNYLNTVCFQVQMSAQSLYDKLEEMKRYGMITIRGNDIFLDE